MTTAVADVLQAAMALSPAEREEVAETLLESIDGETDERVPDEAWLSEIGRRVSEVRSGTVTMLTRSEVDAMVAEGRAARAM